jgi:hypothetical protein
MVSDGLDKCFLARAAHVRAECQWPVGRQNEVALVQFRPDQFVDPLWIARAGREEIEHQKVNPAAKKFGRFLSKSADCGLRALIAGLHDFDDRQHLLIVHARPIVNRHGTLLRSFRNEDVRCGVYPPLAFTLSSAQPASG